MRHRLYGRQRDRRACELTMRRVCEFPLSEATWCDLAVNNRPPNVHVLTTRGVASRCIGSRGSLSVCSHLVVVMD